MPTFLALKRSCATSIAVILFLQSRTGEAQDPRASAASPKVITIPAASIDEKGPTGLFYRLKVNFSSGNRLETYTIAFLPSNRVTRTYPFGGAESFDQARCNPDMCGTYQVSADAIAIRWDNGQSTSWTYRRTPDGFDLDGDSYKPARPLTTSTLVGMWAGASTAGSGAQNSYVFRTDGTFSLGAATVRNLDGRFVLRGTTLTLTWADGTQERRTVFAANANNPPTLVSIEGDAFRRQ